MLDIKALERKEVNPQTQKTYLEEYKQDLRNRGEDPDRIEKVLEINNRRRVIVNEFEVARAEQNRVGQVIAQLKRNKQDASRELSEMQALSAKLKEMDKKVQEVDAELHETLATFPNKFHHTVPVGKSEADNVVVRAVGEPTQFSFKAKDHAELAEKLGILNLERAAKVTGSRFYFLLGAAARLERALIQFMMDLHSREHGYEEMIPPFMVNSASMFGVGQFPKFKEDVFHVAGTDYYLIPTAETSVTNYFANEILEEDQLPSSFCAYSPCFRSEAGTYGKDTRGIFRVHQFNKVELLHFAHPGNSYELHEKLVGDAENVLKHLELPYRVVNKCTADMTFSSAKCYDLEVWLPGQNAYREISSCSNFEDFQARRANIRFRPKDKGKPQFVHTLNGSGLAIGRTLIAILENFQQEDGSILLPKAIRPYMGGKDRIDTAHRAE